MKEKIKIIRSGFSSISATCYLTKKGYQVKVLDNCSMGSDGIMSFLGYPSYSLIRGDIRDIKLLEKSMKDIDFVVHLAAIVGEPACRKFEEDAKSINLLITMNVFN